MTKYIFAYLSVLFLSMSVLFIGSASWATMTFDGCLKKVVDCKQLLNPAKKNAEPKKLKAFLDSVTSFQEQEKYDCVLKHAEEGKRPLECRQPLSHFEFHQACYADILQFCKTTKPGEHRISECLEKNEADLSYECKKHIKKDHALCSRVERKSKC